MIEREKFTTLTSAPVIFPFEDVDTDQIIPARYLTTTTREGLGAHLFHDWRYDGSGSARVDFVLNDPLMAGRTILVAGHNFGCGSSREHAPWALADYGFRVVMSTGIADIFYSNAIKNGLLPVRIPRGTYDRVLSNPDDPITVDLKAPAVLVSNDMPVPFEIEPFARHCLLTGLDELGILLARDNDIAKYEASRT